jgi:copper resistance protein C
MKTIKTLALSVALLAGLLPASGVLAHAKMQMAMPAANSAGASPKSIMVHFNDKITSKLSGFEVTGPDGKAVALDPQVDKSGLMLTAKVSKPLAPGLYKVAWHAVTSDGHRMTGNYSFTVK